MKGESTLPVNPTGRLAEVLAAVNPNARKALEKHLLGGTSANWLAAVLTSEGYPIGCTTIKMYRHAVKMHNDGSV